MTDSGDDDVYTQMNSIRLENVGNSSRVPSFPARRCLGFCIRFVENKIQNSRQRSHQGLLRTRRDFRSQQVTT